MSDGQTEVGQQRDSDERKTALLAIANVVQRQGKRLRAMYPHTEAVGAAMRLEALATESVDSTNCEGKRRCPQLRNYST